MILCLHTVFASVAESPQYVKPHFTPLAEQKCTSHISRFFVDEFPSSAQ